MALANTTDSYGAVCRIFHWLTALLILTAMPLGLIAYNLPEGSDAEISRKALTFSIHKTVGIAAFFVALARILWTLTQTKPNAVHPDRKAETVLAETVHWVLYVSLVIVPLSGWLHHAALTGFAPILWPFGQTLPFVPQSAAVADFFGAWHWLFTKVLGAAIFLHIAGALKHALIEKDGVLARMVSGRPAGPASGHHARSPLLYAWVLWAATIAAGSALALVGGEEREVEALAEVDSQWTVESGTLEIEILQLGSATPGSFEGWTAAINFDETAAGDQKGSAEVTIAIGSLDLSGVVEQALSAEFFNVEAFPTAIFAADIFATDDTYEARGTLTIKDISVPVVLPFTLTIEDDLATVSGSLTLDRRDFDIGTQTYADESNLGFPVEVKVNLTARR